MIRGNKLYFFLSSEIFYSDLKKIFDNTANGGSGGGPSRRRRRQQQNNYDVPTNLSENPNNPTQRNRRDFVDVDDAGSADEDTTKKEKKKNS